MTIETVGSFLPNEKLIEARKVYDAGRMERSRLALIEDEAVRDIVERQIACGLPYVTSGELRRKDWAKDFWFGLDGVSCEHVDTGRVYQSVETSVDLVHITGRIGYNPDHPFFSDFTFLADAVARRAKCRQTLPSPANLLLEVFCQSDGYPHQLYASVEDLITDIAEAYRLTLSRFYALGCDSVQFDDTACGLMCDDNFTKRLLQGGVDLLELHKYIISVINASVAGLPDGMEISVYLSGGGTIVPEWEYIEYPDNIMPKALSSLNVNKFFLPFNINDDYALEILRHIPDDKKVVVGLTEAHSPFPEDTTGFYRMIKHVGEFILPENLSVSPKTGFKLSTYASRALTYEDQWQKIIQLKRLFA